MEGKNRKPKTLTESEIKIIRTCWKTIGVQHWNTATVIFQNFYSSDAMKYRAGFVAAAGIDNNSEMSTTALARTHSTHMMNFLDRIVGYIEHFGDNRHEVRRVLRWLGKKHDPVDHYTDTYFPALFESIIALWKPTLIEVSVENDLGSFVMVANAWRNLFIWICWMMTYTIVDINLFRENGESSSD